MSMDHVVVTYESETKRLRLYVDGAMAHEGTVSGGDWSLEYPDFTKMARDGGVPVSHAEALIIELKRKNAAAMTIVREVADSNPYGMGYPADSGVAGVVCRWCMERARSPQQCQHDHECTWRQARALLAAETGTATREETEE